MSVSQPPSENCPSDAPAPRHVNVRAYQPSSFAMRIGMIVALMVLLRQLARAMPRLGGGALAPEALDE